MVQRVCSARRAYRLVIGLLASCVVTTCSAQTQTYTESVLFNFCSRLGACADGAVPNGLIQGSDGNFYGTTSQPGGRQSLDTRGGGTVFKITPSGALTTIYKFCSQGGNNCTDGYAPEANLLEGSDGSFYGTTSAGGTGNASYCSSGTSYSGITVTNSYNGCGTVFKITPSGIFTTLYSFCTQGGASCADGFFPALYGRLAEGSDGNFYGTTAFGGANSQGTVFKITPSGTLTTLYNFCGLGAGYCHDGSNPLFGLIAGSDGNFYGSTSLGGISTVAAWGTIFQITPSGSITTLHSFCSPDCSTGVELTSLIEGDDGNFYGTTFSEGGYGGGTVFELTSSGDDYYLLHTFCSAIGTCPEGADPVGLVQASDGNFYGVGFGGGAGGGGLAGTLFKIVPSGTPGTLTTLYDFCSHGGADCTDGETPIGLVQGSDGNLYGTTALGGANGTGAVFKLTVSPAAPVLTSGTLANGATYLAGGLVPGSWAQVKGTDLSNATRIWDATDFAGLGSNLPTKLSGVQVMVNNLPAAVYYISPGQISFQVPAGISGTASVQVINNGMASNTLTASAANNSPGIFPVIENGTCYPAGVFYSDGEYVGDPAVNPSFRNAQPGDVIELYATGLVPTPAGVLPVTQGVAGVTVTIGNVTVPADFAGLVAVGEFQINFTVPQQFATEPAGEYPISIQVNGVSSPATIDTSPPGLLVLPIEP